MKGIDSLTRIQDRECLENIRMMADRIVSQINPIKVILFGSFADGSYSPSSDFDFYIVVDDGRNVNEASYLAYKSIRDIMSRPVDIVIGTYSRFESKCKARNTLMIEGEVYKNGILLYDSANHAAAERRAAV